MLKLPSLDLVFSSNRGELENPTGAHPADGSHPSSSTPAGQHVPKPPPSKGLPNTTFAGQSLSGLSAAVRCGSAPRLPTV